MRVKNPTELKEALKKELELKCSMAGVWVAISSSLVGDHGTYDVSFRHQEEMTPYRSFSGETLVNCIAIMSLHGFNAFAVDWQFNQENKNTPYGE